MTKRASGRMSPRPRKAPNAELTLCASRSPSLRAASVIAFALSSGLPREGTGGPAGVVRSGETFPGSEEPPVPEPAVPEADGLPVPRGGVVWAPWGIGVELVPVDRPGVDVLGADGIG